MDSDSGLPGGAAEALRQGPEGHARPSGKGDPRALGDVRLPGVLGCGSAMCAAPVETAE